MTVSPGQGSGTCFGDSGGPILNDNTDTVLAVHSYVTGILRAQAPPFSGVGPAGQECAAGGGRP